jgi:hypothetical protein
MALTSPAMNPQPSIGVTPPSASTVGNTTGNAVAAPPGSTVLAFPGSLGANPSANPALNFVGARSSQLVAGTVTTSRPNTLVNTWQGAIQRAPVSTPQPGGLTPQGGRPGAVQLPPRLITVPSPATTFSANTPLATTFATGSRMVQAPDLPQMSSTVAVRTQTDVNEALTASDWSSRFAALTPQQQEVARAYLSAAINAYEQPAYASGRIDKSELNQVVPMILSSAGQWQPPAAVAPQTQAAAPVVTTPNAPLPSPTARTSPLPDPTGVTSALPDPNGRAERPGETTPSTQSTPPRGEITPDTEGAQPPGGTPPRGRPPAAGATPPPEDSNGLGYPSTGPNDPKPAWWDSTVAGNRTTADGLRRLIADGRDFLNQVESIALTPEQQSAWNTWKAA